MAASPDFSEIYRFNPSTREIELFSPASVADVSCDLQAQRNGRRVELTWVTTGFAPDAQFTVARQAENEKGQKLLSLPVRVRVLLAQIPYQRRMMCEPGDQLSIVEFAQKARVAIVQPNTPLHTKMDPGTSVEQFETLRVLSRDAAEALMTEGAERAAFKPATRPCAAASS